MAWTMLATVLRQYWSMHGTFRGVIWLWYSEECHGRACGVGVSSRVGPFQTSCVCVCVCVKCVKLILVYSLSVSERSIGQRRVQLTINGIIKTVVGLSCLWLVWENRSEPVVSLPDTLVWPLGPVLSFPSCQYGQVRKYLCTIYRTFYDKKRNFIIW